MDRKHYDRAKLDMTAADPWTDSGLPPNPHKIMGAWKSCSTGLGGMEGDMKPPYICSLYIWEQFENQQIILYFLGYPDCASYLRNLDGFEIPVKLPIIQCFQQTTDPLVNSDQRILARLNLGSVFLFGAKLKQ